MLGIDEMLVDEKKAAKKWLVLAAIIPSSFVAALDASIVNTVLPDIIAYFKAASSIAQWVLNAYLLAVSCFLLFLAGWEI